MTPEKHIEETPEMAKARKARAALKNVAASTAEILNASDIMSKKMKGVACTLRDYAKKIGDGVMLKDIEYASNSWHTARLSEQLQRLANELDANAV